MNDNFPEARRWVEDYATTTGGAKAYVAHQLAGTAAGLLAALDDATAQRDLNSDLLDGAARALGIDLEDPDVHYAYEIPGKVAELRAELAKVRAQRDRFHEQYANAQQALRNVSQAYLDTTTQAAALPKAEATR
ncbi:hypothetical protein ACQP2C_32620 [Micromonospora zamorensis]|uniref:hypothetical protein n=1 Tax=Micromonospora zamorensis TaxID=709883 RepID=UPI003D979E9B